MVCCAARNTIFGLKLSSSPARFSFSRSSVVSWWYFYFSSSLVSLQAKRAEPLRLSTDRRLIFIRCLLLCHRIDIFFEFRFCRLRRRRSQQQQQKFQLPVVEAFFNRLNKNVKIFNKKFKCKSLKHDTIRGADSCHTRSLARRTFIVIVESETNQRDQTEQDWAHRARMEKYLFNYALSAVDGICVMIINHFSRNWILPLACPSFSSLSYFGVLKNDSIRSWLKNFHVQGQTEELLFWKL